MKNFILLLTVFFYSLYIDAQNTTLKLIGTSPTETAVIDSIGYSITHENFQSIKETQKILEEKLNQIGFLFLEQQQLESDSLSLVIFKYQLHHRLNQTQIDLSAIDANTKKLLQLQSDTINIPFHQTQATLQSLTNQLEQLGYGTSSLKLNKHQISNTTLLASLQIDLDKKRKLDKIEIISDTKIPKQLLQNLLKHKKNQPLTNHLIEEIDRELKLIPFIKQRKTPEILFTTDSTKVYLYADRFNASRFDGIVGFNNDEKGKVQFNGYLNLHLLNILNYGEEFHLEWKNDGNKQTLFDLGTEIPYLFKSPIGLKAKIEIFKQDSTFQNTKIDLNLGYYFSYFSKSYIGYQTTSSVTPENSSLIQSFDNRFITLSYDYKRRRPEDILFPEKTVLFTRIGSGKRSLETTEDSQKFIELNTFNNFIFNPRNSLYTHLHLYSLFSKNYITNELMRFGGHNSIRGFQENSLQGNFFTTLSTEYRYKLSPTLYAHSILDYGLIEDKTTGIKENLYSFGVGFGIMTKNGKLNLIYANGNTGKQEMELKNSIVHITFSTAF
ncbi:hypothetical protein [Flavobacterium sp. NKUCC04_CG]|uniref:hypothetical protein n=1 Tax=Flavobacterium sp. NKUCC04_CG TaxID=2842121 RepID=UPI001C5AAB24|nr:hypothetical protein [Flavobacterium sp. NKUCC04_CG]MBW3517642.1 hypothetical protein [Flavobacterium sp. NKUCC04_CG]